MEVTDELLDELERASGSTPGSWETSGGTQVWVSDDGTPVALVNALERHNVTAVFIATANPEVIRAMVAEVRRLQALVDIAEAAIRAGANVDEWIEQVRREEREACIGAVDSQYDNSVGERSARFDDGITAAIEAIRARGEKE